jgi:lysophospholipase L1-like esterase
MALGDSFTEGLCDAYELADGTPNTESGLLPDAVDLSTYVGNDNGMQRGWADRLATILAERRAEAGLSQFEYANLAIRGRKLGQIISEQVSVALEERPDLVSIVGGGNDILRPGADIDDLTNQLDEAVGALRAAGCEVLMATGFRAGGGLAWTQRKTGPFNSTIWTLARKHACYVLDLWGLKSLFDNRLWAVDRLHMIPEGHRRVAQAALFGLGLEVDDPEFDAPLPPAVEIPLADRVKADAQWSKEYVGPWVKRRLRQESSGDGREPKWPGLTAWPPAGPLGA